MVKVPSYELLNKLFPLYIVTDEKGLIQKLGCIFPDVSQKIVSGRYIGEYLFSKHDTIAGDARGLIKQNGSLFIPTGIRGVDLKMFGLDINETRILWVSNIIPGTEVSIKELPGDFKHFYQYDILVEQLLSLNSVRLSLRDADNLYKRVVEKNKELQTAHSKYRHVVESVNDIIFQTDEVGNWSFLNNAWEKTMGFSLDESIGQPFFNFLHPDDVKRNEELFTPLIARQKEYCSHQIRYITKDGSVKWMKVYAVLIINDKDEIKGTSGTITDVTAEINNMEKYRLLADNINDIVCIVNRKGEFEYVSLSAEQLTGYKTDDIEGTKVLDIIHPDDIPEVKKRLEDIANATGFSIYRIKFKNGSYHWVETSNRITRNKLGEVDKVITSTRIIDQKIMAEENAMRALEERRKLNDQRSTFISLASHEFRTPITSIQMSTDIIRLHLSKMDVPLNEELARHIEIINKEVSRFQAIMNDILTLGKTENNTITLKKSKVDIMELIRACIQRVSEVMRDERKVALTSLGEPRNVYIDPVQMEHIVENLISNAMKFSKGKAAPEMMVVFHKEKFSVLIKDHGIGIPDSDQVKLFSSFYRASNTEGIKGTGLGLVIIKNLVRLHKGTIDIESKEGQGTKVVIAIKG